MKKIESYSITYQTSDDAGTIHLALSDNQTGSVYVDSPQEAHFVLYMLHNEEEVYFDSATGLLIAGFQPGEQLQDYNDEE